MEFLFIICFFKYNNRKTGLSHKEQRRLTKRLPEQYLAFRRHRIHCDSCEYCKLIERGDVPMPPMTCPQCGEVPSSRQHVYRNLSKSQPSLIDSRHYEISFPKASHLILPNENFHIIDGDDFEISQMYP